MPGRDSSRRPKKNPSWTRWEDLDNVSTLDRSSPTRAPGRSALPEWEPAFPDLRDDPAVGEPFFSESALAPWPSGDGNGSDASFCPSEFSVLDLGDRVVETLLLKQIVDIDQVAEARERRKKQKDSELAQPLWRILAAGPGVDREGIFAEAAALAGFKPAQIDRAAARDFVRDQVYVFSERHWQRMLERRILPIEHHPDGTSGKYRFVFATFDPSNPDVSRLMRELRIPDYVLRYASESELEALISDLAEGQVSIDAGLAEVLFVDCLAEVMRRGASAIHIGIDSEEDRISIDLRVEGALEHWRTVSNVDSEEFLAVVKKVGLHLDAVEPDDIQDGRNRREIDGPEIHFEASVLPITEESGGPESSSLGVGVEAQVCPGLRQIGLPERTCSIIERSLLESSGMIVVTGPPESRRTATIDAVLSDVASTSRRVLALEDVVENEGGHQDGTSSRLDHGKALEAVCAHDPDVVVAGDLRSRQIAELALRLANRGRLVVAKLSAYDSADALSRFVEMGIEPVLTAYAIDLIVAQRSVRRLCPICKRPLRHLDGQMLRRLGFSHQDLASGSFYEEGTDDDCGTCAGTGYTDDRILTETMPVSHDIRRLVALTESSLDDENVRALAVRDGMLTLRAAAREAVLEGEISVAELIRATAGDH